MSKITLKPGDYVSTKGMTEEQYHAVAEAFMAAGAERGEYPNEGYALRNSGLPAFGWGGPEVGLYHGQMEGTLEWGEEPRLLRVSDVLMSQSFKKPDPIATLRTARKERDEAEAAYQSALEVVRAELGDGFELLDTVEPQEDMSDPQNWREGDVVEWVGDTHNFYTQGNLYKIKGYGREGMDDFEIEDDENECPHYWDNIEKLKNSFRFHHRP